MALATFLKSAFWRRRVIFGAVALAFLAARACEEKLAADDGASYVSSYSNASSSEPKPRLGISQYKDADRAASYRYSVSQNESSNAPTGSETLYSTHERYSSLNNSAPSESELQERYAASTPTADYDAYPIGSDAYFAAKTRDAKARDALNEDAFSVSSGLGSQRKTSSKGLFGYAVETNARDGETFRERWIEPDVPKEAWTSQLLPQGLMYSSYLAGRKESRLQSVIAYEDGYGTLWDVTLGGRAPIWRFGTNDVVQPEGWEIELEGSALLRLDWERGRSLAATDYRAGLPIVYGTKRWQFKTGYYHVSSHLGDNYLLDGFRRRIHYVRDSVMFGLSFKPTSDVRLYTELDLAFHCGKTTDPVELQFGVEYSPQFDPESLNLIGRPFLASHAHLYQESDFGGNWTTQLGVQWRGPTNSLLRVGGEYFMGRDDQYQFYKNYQRKYGFGVWYDF